MKAGVYEALTGRLAAEQAVVVATAVAGPVRGRQLLIDAEGIAAGSLGAPDLDRRVAQEAGERLAELRSDSATYEGGEEEGDETIVFFDVQPPRDRLVLVGAVHVAIPLVAMASALGYETVVVDPRSAFATEERFAHADRLLAEWPDEAFEQIGLSAATCVVALSHDFKIDLPALRLALASPARYIGALGSRKTRAKRLDKLRADGFGDDDLARIHAPIGLPLGGRKPEEIATSILAEIVASRYGKKLIPAPELDAD